MCSAAPSSPGWKWRTHEGSELRAATIGRQYVPTFAKAWTAKKVDPLGLLPAMVYRQNAKLVNATMLEISRQMGHERKKITGVYIGTVAKLEKGQHKRITGWLDQLDAVGPVMAQEQVVEAWMVGTCGTGGMLRPGEPMALAVRMRAECRALPHGEISARLSEVRYRRTLVDPPAWGKLPAVVEA